jgi:subtilisin family serine protease
MQKFIPLLGFLWTCALIAQPVEHVITRCSTVAIPLAGGLTDLELERCANDVAENAMWQVDRSDSVSGELNGFAMRRTTGRGSVVYVVDTGILQRHDEFQRPDGDNVLGGFDAVAAAGLPSATPCPDFPLEPCGNRTRYGHGTAVASAVAGLHSGVAPEASLYSIGIIPPTRPGSNEI